MAMKLGYETDEIIEERFESLLQKYQSGLEERIRGNEFVFDSANLLCYKLLQNKFKSRRIIYRFSKMVGKQKSNNKS